VVCHCCAIQEPGVCSPLIGSDDPNHGLPLELTVTILDIRTGCCGWSYVRKEAYKNLHDHVCWSWYGVYAMPYNAYAMPWAELNLVSFPRNRHERVVVQN
jgi:hypothetical protein